MRVAARAGRASRLRVAVWVLHMLLPVALLALLLRNPRLDVRWENDPVHFWLVAGVAGLNSLLGFRMSEEARARGDGRLFLVGLAFLAAAGFFALHAMATPGVLVEGGSLGFNIAMPVGLLLASVLVLVSSLELDERRWRAVMRWQHVLRYGLGALMVAWAFLSLYELPPLDTPLGTGEVLGPLVAASVVAVLLYAVAALRYFGIHRRRPAVLLLGLVTAFVLLGEAMANVVMARNWHLSWWLWHVVVGAAFAYMAYSAHVHYRREGGASGLFAAISLERTIHRMREEYGAALESLVSALDAGGAGDREAALRRVAAEFDLTEGQAEVLRRAALALAAERHHVRRLAALASVGRRAEVGTEEHRLLREAVAELGSAFEGHRIRVGLDQGGELRFLPELDSVPGTEPEGEVLELPLEASGRRLGAIEVWAPAGEEFEERDRWLLDSLASQLTVALENRRLYRQVHELLRRYTSPDVAAALLADERWSELGGERREVSVLFADLRGFTAFSEDASPRRVVELLNAYFESAVPVVLREGGTVDKFVGDAVVAIFNAPVLQPDHALRATRAALAMQEVTGKLADRDPGLPRFRIGVNTGPAVVGSIGSPEIRNFTAIGDAVNVAARLQAAAPPGRVVIGPTTYALVRDLAVARPLDPMVLEGRSEAVRAYLVEGLREEGAPEG